MPVRLSSFIARVAIARIAKRLPERPLAGEDPRAALPGKSSFRHGVANPVRVPVAGEGVPLLVKRIVPLRFTPRGEPGLVNRTPPVQVPPGGRDRPVQAFWPTTRLKK